MFYLNTLITIFWPLKTLAYFEKYLALVETIYIFQNVRLLIQLKLFNIITMITAVHFFYLSNPYLTEFERTLHFDGCYILIPSSHLNTIAGAVAILNLYYLKVLKKGTNLRLLQGLGQILIFGKLSTFFSSKKNHLFHQSDQKSQEMIVKLRHQYFVVMNAFQSLTLVISEYPFHLF